MLKLVHRNKQFIGIVFLVIAFCFAISGIGLDVVRDRAGRSQYALKVNDREFSAAEFSATEKRIEEQYRRMFGSNYQQMKKMLGNNVAQQALDSLVDGYLIETAARSFGFAVGTEESNRFITEKLFAQGGGFRADAYRAYLQNTGTTAPRFEAEVRTSLLREHITQVVEDVSRVSESEARAELERQELTRKVVLAVLSEDVVRSEIKEPSPDELNTYYDAHATEFELPARVAFEYLLFDGNSFESAVNIQPQDVELYYSENTSKFTNPEEIKARSIKLLYPKEKDPAKMAEVKERAKKAHEEATSGAPFENLVSQYSEDLAARATGGDLGWVRRGKLAPEIDKAAFELKGPGITQPIELGYGFEIVKVEDYKPASEKNLDEVRGIIETTLKSQEAPSFAAARAGEVLEKAKKSDASLATFVKDIPSLKGGSTSGLIDGMTLIEGAPKDLAAKILQLPEGERAGVHMIDDGDSTILVKISEYRQPEVPALEVVRTKVIDSWRSESAKKIMSERAAAFLKDTVDSKKKLQEAALPAGFKLVGPEETGKTKPLPKEFNSAELDKAVASTFKESAPFNQIFTIGDSLVLAQVIAVSLPPQGVSEAEVAAYRDQASQSARTVLLESLMAHLKKSAEIDFDPLILSNNS